MGYDQFSEDYDRFVNWDARLKVEMPFLHKTLRGRRSSPALRVLDAACGTGKHAIQLARDGLRCAGADLSQGMITRARQNAGEAGVEVRFEAVGFGGLAAAFGKGEWDGLLCLGNSLPHVLTDLELQAALRDFAACLAPGGRLILQNRNFHPVLRLKERWMEPQGFREGEREWVFLRLYDFDPDGLITFHVINLFKGEDASWSQQVHTTRLRPLLLEELEPALKEAGFREIETYGNLAGERYDPVSSGNLVLVAHKG